MNETELLRQMVEELKAMRTALGAAPKAGSKDPKSGAGMSEFDKQLHALAKSLLAHEQKVKDGLKKLDDWNKHLSDTEQTIASMREELSNTEMTVEERAEKEKALAKAQKKFNEQLDEFTRAKFAETMGQQFGQLSKATGNAAVAMVSSSGNILKSLQSGGSDMQVASGMMTAGVELAGSAGNALGKGMGAVGAAIAPLGPVAAAAGAGLTVLGAVTSAVSNKMKDAAKFGITVLTAEIEKLINGYRSTISSGALFADALDGLKEAAGKATVPLEVFSQIIKNNSTTLASTGYSVAGGAHLMSLAMQKGGEDFKRRLLKLGYSVEEQGGLIAEVMADARRVQSPLGSDPAALVKMTDEYGKNLRMISALTGEDAKSKMQEMRQKTANVAFQAKMRDLEKKQPEVASKLNQAMITMTDAQRTAVVQMLGLGAVADKSTAVMMETIPGFKDVVLGTVQAVQSGNFDLLKSQRLQAASNKKMEDNIGQMVPIAQAGLAGKYTDISAGMSESFEKARQITVEAVQQAQEAAKKIPEATGDLTKGIVQASLDLNNMRIAIENSILGPDVLGSFAKAVSMTTNEMLKAVKAIQDYFKEEDTITKQAAVNGVAPGVQAQRNAKKTIQGTANGGQFKGYNMTPTEAANILAGGSEADILAFGGRQKLEEIAKSLSTVNSNKTVPSSAKPQAKITTTSTKSSTPSSMFVPPASGGIAKLEDVSPVVTIPGFKSVVNQIKPEIPLAENQKNQEKYSTQSTVNLDPLVSKLNEQIALMREQTNQGKAVADKLDESIKVNKSILAYAR